MRVKPLRLALLLGVWAALPALAGRTYKLEPIRLQSPFSPLVYLDWTPEPPAEAGTMPAFGSPIPVFSTLKLGDKPPMLMAADVVQQGGTSRCTVYLDTNWNGSLAGERGYPLQPIDLNGTRLVATEEIRIALRYHIDAGDVVNQYAFRLATEPDAPAPYGPPYAMYVEYGRSAVVDLGGSPVRLTVCDADGDAKVTVGGGAEGDRYLLDTDLPACPSPQSFARLTSPIRYGGDYYDLSLRPDGGEVTVGPYSGPVARLAVAGHDSRGGPAEVAGLDATGEGSVVTFGKVDGALTLLPGKYRITYVVNGPGSRAFVFSTPEPLTLGPGTATQLQCGGPLSLDVDVSAGLRGDGWVLTVTARAHTQAGHLFEATGQEALPGEAVVLNLDGEVVAEGRLARDGATLAIPGAQAGARYVLRVVFDCGGYQAPIVRQVPVTLKVPVG